MSMSIHALRVEGDSGHGFHVYYLLEISIHALRVEGDFVPWLNSLTEHEFLSTPSGWRATALPATFFSCSSNFYPRPPGGGRQRDIMDAMQFYQISIHALRVEGDIKRIYSCVYSAKFLSTPSGWRATATSTSHIPT